MASEQNTVEGNRAPTFCLLIDPPAPGPWNMAVDETLLEAAASDEQCTLRFYGWSEPTLSLGYFQTCADRRRHSPSLDCAAVRRQSGGGAILHDRELTYSIAVPERHPLAVGRLQFYQTVHQTLIEVLALWGVVARMFSDSPGRQVSSTTEDKTARPPFLCFQRRSPGDVLVGDVKIAGSAQRRCRGAVLQHGSILLARSTFAPELAGLKELAGLNITPQKLLETWLPALQKSLSISCHKWGLANNQYDRAKALACGKYISPDWLENRSCG